VLLSGGLDSATTLALAIERGFVPHCLTVRYGQRHEAEIDAAREVARAAGAAAQVVVDVDLALFGGSALTTDGEIPKDRSGEEMATGIPVTYVPARNTVLLSLALSWAEAIGARDIFVGVNAVDYSGYPDCRPEFIRAFEQLANVATKAGVEGTAFRVHTPLIALTKAQIIVRGSELGIDYSITVTCYDPDVDGRACGHCDACQLRRRGFDQAQIPDPTIYQPAHR
jgi:7-cyano-7-deazaguanine synthase